MKKTIKFLAIFIAGMIPVTLFAQSGVYTVTVKVAPLPPNAMAYLMRNSEGRQTDSSTIVNGTVNFTGTVDHPIRAILIINNKGTGLIAGLNHIQFILEPATISLVSADSLDNAKVKGTQINDDYTRLNNVLAPVKAKIMKLSKEYRSVSAEVRSSKQFSDDFDKRDSLAGEEEKAVYMTFIKDDPNSLVSLFALKDYEGPAPNIVEAEQLFNSLSADVRNSKIGIDYASALANKKKTAIGTLAPDFTLADTAGKPISLHDFRGKYVLVDFWASWCGPCRAENPNVVKAYAQYQSKGLEILGVSLDSPASKAAWLKAILNDHLTWTEVSDLKGFDNNAAQLYSIKAIPQNVLVDPVGKIVAKNLKGDELQTKLTEIFGK